MTTVNNNSILDKYRWDEETRTQPKDATGQQQLEQEDFFQLLTQQLNMQDPTKPVDNDQMIAQMTSFSMAEGITNMSQKFDEFAQSMASNQALQASTLVGRNVMIPSGDVYLEEGAQASGMIAAPLDASNAKLTIKDEKGAVVRTIQLGDLPKGVKDFTWDGKDESGELLPEGKYTISANARIGDSNEELPIQMGAKVASVSMGSQQGIILNLKGLGGVALSDISEIS
ncbi:flagellar hook assembly protein FlgD [Idiomarina xiamenensis]|uniref:Basal-body rod modification protein FlgD n=1 Tax=Idiomarina xiamenensis 10-D-4 TaxID=740709 RepID=K2KHB8_9GAMM|nr:flagellar hook assembly protein FlgD [Idiomarina xiamenensis]EKE82059.1 flagellar basal body rod modification protein [Idiomarina xiamenensis 10-D-4]